MKWLFSLILSLRGQWLIWSTECIKKYHVTYKIWFQSCWGALCAWWRPAKHTPPSWGASVCRLGSDRAPLSDSKKPGNLGTPCGVCWRSSQGTPHIGRACERYSGPVNACLMSLSQLGRTPLVGTANINLGNNWNFALSCSRRIQENDKRAKSSLKPPAHPKQV